MRTLSISLCLGALGLGFSGCSDGSPPSTCAGLDEAACTANPECRAILGGPAAEYCAGNLDNWNTVWAGCTEIDQGCGDAETCASDPATGTRLYFPDTCVPQGWLPCDCSVPAACEMGGDMVSVGQICVRGMSGIAGESLVPDEPVHIEVIPEGCFGSGCVTVYDSVCQAALSGVDISVSSLFCIGPSGADTCLPDCGGAGSASCFTEALASGTYTVTSGALSVEFTIPSELPFGGVCDGQAFVR